MKNYKSKENDDEIVLEGIHAYKKLLLMLAVIYIIVSLVTLGLALLILPCLIAANCFCLSKWRVYITHNELYNNRGFGFTVIPFSEIAHIYVMSGTIDVQITKTDGTSLRLHLENCDEFVAAVKNEIARNQQREEYLAHSQLLKQTQFKTN